MHIFEARRLLGNNLKPMVKVTCGSAVQSTGVRRGTENPYWDEVRMLECYIKCHEGDSALPAAILLQ